MPEYTSPVQPARPTVDVDAINKMIETLSGAADTVSIAGKVARDVRTAFGLPVAFMASQLGSILPGRVATIDRGVTTPTVDEAWKMLEWAKDVATMNPKQLASVVEAHAKRAKAAAKKSTLPPEAADVEPDDQPIELD